MSVVVVATITPRPGEYEAVVAALVDVIPKVHAEPGCELYALHESGDQLVMIEKWATTEALDAHGSGAALAALGGALKGRVAGPPEVRRLSAHPAGDADRGAV